MGRLLGSSAATSTRRALGHMALSATLWAFMNLFARLASTTAPWALVGATRAFIGAFVAFGVARARGASLVVHDRRTLFWRCLFGTASMTGTFLALSSPSLPLGDTVTLLNLSPVFLALLAPVVLRERTSGSTVLALTIALAGVVLVLRPEALFAHAPRPFPATGAIGASTTALLALVASFFASLAMMMLRRVGQHETPEGIAFQFSLFAGFALTLIALLDLRLPSLRGAGFMVLAGVCAGFAQLGMTRAYALERAARVGGLAYLSVVVSALLGAALLGERPDTLAVIGMVLVIAGGLVVTFAREHEAS